MVEMVCHYEQETELARRRHRLTLAFTSLPGYASPAFWLALQSEHIPLEVLTRCARTANAYRDIKGEQRICTIILRRLQPLNSQWARQILALVDAPDGEQDAMVADLCSDLCEHVLRALSDPQRFFWEENFMHALYFERKHVARSFMIKEGYWRNPQSKQGTRVLRVHMERLNQPDVQESGVGKSYDIEDERAQAMLQAVEQSDLLRLVLQLPDQLKAVILLIFWEGRSEKETAQLLNVSDRTVRNRLHRAYTLLRPMISLEKEEGSYGL